MIHTKQRGMMVAMEGEKGMKRVSQPMEGEKGMKRVSGAWACS